MRVDPAIDADFYALEQLLDADGRQLIMTVRDFMEKSRRTRNQPLLDQRGIPATT